MDNENFDIVVIGSGVIGHSIAFRLKQDNPHLEIAVLGDPVNSLQASRAAAGMLAPFCECDKADQFFRFCRDSLDKFPLFLEELVSVSEVPVHFSPAGSLMPSSNYRDTWEERKAFFIREDIPHEIWNMDKVRQKVPYLAEDCGEEMWVGD
jgi:glycine oxidase